MATELFKKIASKFEGNDCVWQQVLNIGYEHWQNNNSMTYSEMASWLDQNYGPLAKMALLLGKYNQQVGNGGHEQYFSNGYASKKCSGCFTNYDEIDLHIELITLVREYLKIPQVEQLLSILTDFKIDEDNTCQHCDGDGSFYDEEEDETEDCSYCGGDGYVSGDGEFSVVCSDSLDDRYYALNIDDSITGFYDNLLSALV